MANPPSAAPASPVKDEPCITANVLGASRDKRPIVDAVLGVRDMPAPGAAVAGARMSPEVMALLIAFLQESDLIKFSEYTPDAESANRLLARACMIVEATKPSPAADEANGGATPTKAQPATGTRRAATQPMENVA